MLNYIWLGLIVLAVAIGGATQHLKEVSEAAFENARNAVTGLALPLVGVMALWLGLMRLAERAGLVQRMARGLRPLLRWLFPEVPEGDPALGSILMNVSANMLGLANAATPLGLRAMKDLERLNPHPGTATNAMCTFLAINTSSVQLIPASTIAILASQGSKAPTAIIGTALVATACANLVAITAVKLLQHLPVFAPGGPAVSGSAPSTASPEPPPSAAPEPAPAPPARWATPALLAVGLFFGWAVWAQVQRNLATQPLFPATIAAVSLVAVPFLMLFMTVFAATRGVRVYEQFVEGAREGFDTGIRIIPYLVAILVAMGMFRAAGGIEMITRALDPVLSLVHFPTELVPLALMRPLSGSGANGLFAELVKTHGPDSLIARTAATLIGSTETTFYVLAVYFGSVGIRRTRHAVAVGLLGDLAGMIAAVTVCRMVF